MKYFIELVSKVVMSIPIEKKHNRVVDGLKSTPKPWGIEDGIYPCPVVGRNPSGFFRLNRLLGKGVKGDVMYSNRVLKPGFSPSDDRLFIEFIPEKIDYQHLITNAFKVYIDFFSPYTGEISNENILSYDFDNFRKELTLLSSFRFCPVGFWSRSYCEKILRIPLEELNVKVSKYVEETEFFNDGLIIIASSKFLTLEEANEIDQKLKSIVAKHLIGLPYVEQSI